MKWLSIRAAWVSSIAASFVLLAAPAHAEKRVALVIGNNDYRNVPKLQKAVNDARTMGDTLKQLGFNVMVAENLTRQQFSQALLAFDPETARFMKLGALTYADERLILRNRVSIQGRVTSEHRCEMAKVNLGTGQKPKRLNVFAQITAVSSFCSQMTEVVCCEFRQVSATGPYRRRFEHAMTVAPQPA